MAARLRHARVPLAALAACVVAIAAVVASSGGATYTVSFTVASATNLIPGLKVRAAGQPVGAIAALSTVDHGHAARVELELTNHKVWPLPADTHVRLRYGGTVSYDQRYVALEPGTTSATIPDGGTIPTRNVELPVEFDQVFNTFGPRTRQNLRATIDSTGAAFRASRFEFPRALGTSPELLHEAAGLLGDLGDDTSALQTLVSSSDRVVHAAATASPGVGELIGQAATTFQALGTHADSLRRALALMPQTLTVARTTLRRADESLGLVGDVANRLRPGVRRLLATTPALNRLVAAITAVAPDATRTLDTARSGAPDITGLLGQLQQMAPTLTSLGTQGAQQLQCIRPFAPEIGGFVVNWNGFSKDGDHKDKYARLFNSVYGFGNDTPFGAKRAYQLDPGAFASYALPRPPGANVNQPLFLPECHITPAALDPTQDPEDITNDPLSKALVQWTP